VGDKLNLTDDQKKEFAKLRIEMQRKNTPVQSQIRLARLEIQQAMLAEKPDRGKIEKSMREISDLQLQIKLNRLDHMFAMKSVLTPEQQKLWKEQRGNRGMQQRRIRIFRDRGPMGQQLNQTQEPFNMTVPGDLGVLDEEPLDLGIPIDIGVPDQEELEEEVGQE
jgi:Spy/CpxP family protein refolding chaperone